MTALIKLHEVVLRHPDLQFKKPLSWSLYPDEHWAFIGPNGSGKTLFMDVITGKLAIKSGTREYPLIDSLNLSVSESIKAMAFRDINSLSGDYTNTSYQQRWNSQEAESSPQISDLLTLHIDSDYSNLILDLLCVRPLLNRKLIHLSSGELRKFLIVRALMSKPKVLILDNPFIGLDAPSRDLLNRVLETLSGMKGLQLIFVLSNPSDIPDFINHVLPISNKMLGNSISPSDFVADKSLLRTLFQTLKDNSSERVFESFTSGDFTEFHSDDKPVVIQLCDVHIGYDQRTILNQLNWAIMKGERWALLGPNGAGKSTLLSLVCADNPQSYANDIRLFGKKRGSGESIWDIKRHIGYVSPEMHNYYQKNVPCKEIVGSGLFDTIGLYRKCNEEQLGQCAKWMSIFGISALAEKSFRNVSSGEQRLCLLARAFVKEPALLILDEPLHGLDVSNKLMVKKIIDDYCSNSEKTLIYVTHYLHEIPDCVHKQFNLQTQSLPLKKNETPENKEAPKI
jgi:molybdate transport system ATP-binding protein